MNDLFASALTVQDLSEGMSASVSFTVTHEDMLRFAELSGDYNPLHVDNEFARNKGFEGTVVYGALIVAKISALIGMQLPGRDAVWASVTLDFVKPLYVGQAAQVEGVIANVSASTGMLELKLKVRSDTGQVLAKGSAEVRLTQ